MRKLGSFRVHFGALAALAAWAGTPSTGRAVAPEGEAAPLWIWTADKGSESQAVHLRKAFEVPEGIKSARIVVAADNEAAVLLDGRPVIENNDWAEPSAKVVTAALAAPGRHVLAVRGRNQGGPAGLVLRLTIEPKSGPPIVVVSDESWKVSVPAPRGWTAPNFDDSKWAKATAVGKLGDAPWNATNDLAFARAASPDEPKASDPSKFKKIKGFDVELLYTVPKDEQGSWVNMTVDPKGRLIVSDQYGKLYRVTPPPVGKAGEVKIEPIEAEIGEAQGLLWAFDSLYVVVNQGQKYPSGLYRVTDTDGDDKLDKVEALRGLNGGGEHGPHAVILGPDGKSLRVIAGNATALTQLSGSDVPRIYDEDQVLPYLTDGNGFMKDERAPGGCIYEVDPDGKNWVLVSMGYRNPFDLAFNRWGDLFTYDSDMEWDVNTPWYRPTRVCQADPGSDLGYRNGSGKWPTYYPDSLPPTVDIGPGSPTGVTFGYGAKFPAKYQEALFICDWSYGKLYALHLSPDQSHYKAEVEEFVTGQPLALTDVVVNPTDGAMYFAVGGRRTLSGLYRVTYSGAESTAPAHPTDTSADARALRRSLEAFQGRKDPKAIEAAWPNLGHPDRFIRYAARVALEFQPPGEWVEKALAETETQALLTALLAVARVGGKELQPKLLDGLGRLDWDALSTAQKLESLRVLELCLIRMGRPDDSSVAHIVEKLDTLFPAKGRELNAELCKLMIALEAPSAASKTMALLETAPTQEEQIEYATALRKLRTGWTPGLRKAYFEWFPKAANFKGGASLAGFIRQIKGDAVATLSTEEKAALQPILDAKPDAKAVVAVAKPRPFVKAWTVPELAPVAETRLNHRDFDRGRTLFAAASCFNCHRFANEGGTVGPDLTGVSGRFSPRDLLESIVLPSKTVSDQYQAWTFATTDGQVVTGRVVNLNGDTLMINTDMLDPNKMVSINQKKVEEKKPSAVSMMPEGLLNTFHEDEILDMIAYLLSKGDRNSPMFK